MGISGNINHSFGITADQSMTLYQKYETVIPAKFHQNSIWNDAALCIAPTGLSTTKRTRWV